MIDIGGNIHKAISYDQNGDLLDVIQNDKCADGLGIFYTSMARALGISEQELSELALKSTRDVCLWRFNAPCPPNRRPSTCCVRGRRSQMLQMPSRDSSWSALPPCARTMPLKREIVVAGGLAKSQALIEAPSGLPETGGQRIGPSGICGCNRCGDQLWGWRMSENADQSMNNSIGQTAKVIVAGIDVGAVSSKVADPAGWTALCVFSGENPNAQRIRPKGHERCPGQMPSEIGKHPMRRGDRPWKDAGPVCTARPYRKSRAPLQGRYASGDRPCARCSMPEVKAAG